MLVLAAVLLLLVHVSRPAFGPATPGLAHNRTVPPSSLPPSVAAPLDSSPASVGTLSALLPASVAALPASSSSSVAALPASSPASVTALPASLPASVVAALPASVAALPASVAALPASVAALPASVAALPASVATLPASSSASVAALPASVAALPASVAALPASVAALPASVAALPASVAALPASVAALPASVAALPASVAALSASLPASVVAALPASVAALPASVAALPASSSASVVALPASVAALPASVAALPASVAALPASVAALPASVAALSASVASLPASSSTSVIALPASSPTSVAALSASSPASDIAPLTGALYEAGLTRAHPELCPQLGESKRLVILVASAPAHEAARRAVRLTWGHVALRSDVAFGFMLGASPPELRPALDQEDALYGDLIEGRSVDSYSNLTLKTISMLEWFDTYCPLAPRLLKTDDDIFINVPRLLTFEAAHANASSTVWGNIADSRPIRLPSSKYYLSPAEFPSTTFPRYVSGAAYLVTADAVRRLLLAAPEERYLRLEDVFVTGLLAARANVRRVHHGEFYIKKVAPYPCPVRRCLAIQVERYHDQFDLWCKLFEVYY